MPFSTIVECAFNDSDFLEEIESAVLRAKDRAVLRGRNDRTPRRQLTAQPHVGPFVISALFPDEQHALGAERRTWHRLPAMQVHHEHVGDQR